jgi:hypothetical protein
VRPRPPSGPYPRPMVIGPNTRPAAAPGARRGTAARASALRRHRFREPLCFLIAPASNRPVAWAIFSREAARDSPLRWLMPVSNALASAHPAGFVEPCATRPIHARGLTSFFVERPRYQRSSFFNVDAYPANLPVPAFGPRMVCTGCSMIGADARPNWRERYDPGPVTRGH